MHIIFVYCQKSNVDIKNYICRAVNKKINLNKNGNIQNRPNFEENNSLVTHFSFKITAVFTLLKYSFENQMRRTTS